MVVYNFDPNIEEIKKALTSKSIDYAIFVDNSTVSLGPPPSLFSAINLFPDRIVYIKNKGNIGLSKALNVGVKVAKERNCSLIHVLDQDARLIRNYFDEIHGHYWKLCELDPQFGILGPIVSNYSDDIAVSMFRGSFSKVSSLINSGMLIPMSTFDLVGLYDEDLFIGAIDAEFVERNIRNGLSVYRINKVMIVQDFGRTIKPNNVPLKIINFFTKYYSIILMGLGKTNEYRHLLVEYSEMQHHLNYMDKIKYEKKTGTFHILDKLKALIASAIHGIIAKSTY